MTHHIVQTSTEIDDLPIKTKEAIIEALKIAIDRAPTEKQRQRFNAVLITLTAQQGELPGF